MQSVPGRFWTWTAADATGQIQPVLHAFAGTEQGLAALAVTDGPATWAAQAAALRPELDPDPARAILTTWNDDPWAGQSYSADTRHRSAAATRTSWPPRPAASTSRASTPPATGRA